MNLASPVARHNKFIAHSLIICAVMIGVMVVIGGFTRLTGSGLSIVDWRPIMGLLPPLTEFQWGEVFSQYKQFPEYQKVNLGMGLDEFKSIFWLEYIHRLWGRLLGLVLLAPTVYAIIKRQSRHLLPRLGLIWILGSLQGIMGWYMVKSGLVNDPWVSQYRLTAHLLIAFAIMAVVLWTAFSILNNSGERVRLHRPTLIFLGLLVVTITLGGLTAGLHAGKIYNTFPMMGEQWLPDDIMHLSPIWLNIFENPTTVQFLHRVTAISTLVILLACIIKYRTRGFYILASLGLVQVLLGICTLVLSVPIHLAALHQGWALVVFSVGVWYLHKYSHEVPYSSMSREM